MSTTVRPTLPDVLLGYQRFNQWQDQEAERRLPQMTVEESLNQFFELCGLVRPWRPEAELELQWLEEERAPWIEIVKRHRRSKKG